MDLTPPPLHFTNTLTGIKERFTPLNPQEVRMYHCGPTVYDYAHIGNLRSYVFADLLKRTLLYYRYDVKQVINITDIGHLTSDNDYGEDKMTKGLKREGLPLTLEGMKTLADTYTEAFKHDVTSLNILPPDYLPRALEHIEEEISLISTLEEKGYTYSIDEDGIYFDTSAFEAYGALGGLSQGIQHGRVEENTEKRNNRDFALWKFNEDLGFPSPWGQGFPAWHIECSAMSMKYLGETFDIHTGGIDHISIHHNNEIAQSECATEHPLARYWLHHDHVLVKGEKLAKSKGGTITLATLQQEGISPLAYRYWLLSAHYRSSITFTYDALQAAHTSLFRIADIIRTLPQDGIPDQNYTAKMEEALSDDLDTPRVLSLLHDVVKDSSLSPDVLRATILLFDSVLGLNIHGIATHMKPTKIPKKIEDMVQAREHARAEHNWDNADTIRTELAEEGYEVRDTQQGPELLVRTLETH